MIEILVTAVAMIICLIAEGFFSGSEIGVVSADRVKLRHDAAKGSSGAKLALRMLKSPEWLLSTTLVGTNIAVVANTTMATALMIQLFGESSSWLAVILVAPLIWVCGEIVPKSVFQQQADTLTPKVIFVLKFFSYLFFPILVIFSFFARMVSKMAGGKSGQSPFTLREEIKTMMDMSPEEGDIQPEEQNMIRRLFSFSETTAYEIMVPLVDVVSIERGKNCGEAIRLATESMHKLLPVHDQRVDKVVGQVDTIELLGVDSNQPLETFIRSVNYVPGSKSIQTLLLDMRREGRMVSVVVDEFGGAEGIVTVEDIMEEVVDELQDEYDVQARSKQWVRKLSDREYRVSARIELDELNTLIGIELPAGQYASLAGFLLNQMKDIPRVGAVIEYQRITFTIERATPQAIQEVRIRW
ncbi:MAG: HlyC/CorC family transporter [Gammaproteobacteria bacterium]|nr:HlyC/CorC family transporter [Gammaproteobacteria bacterium]